jgi:hypothetical protein
MIKICVALRPRGGAILLGGVCAPKSCVIQGLVCNPGVYLLTLLRRGLRADAPSINLCVKKRSIPGPQRHFAPPPRCQMSTEFHDFRFFGQLMIRSWILHNGILVVGLCSPDLIFGWNPAGFQN